MMVLSKIRSISTTRKEAFSTPIAKMTSHAPTEILNQAAFSWCCTPRATRRNKPVGSGWYLVNLNAGQCAAKKAGTFGCKFDADGNATECGAATVNNATGEIDVVVAN